MNTYRQEREESKLQHENVSKFESGEDPDWRAIFFLCDTVLKKYGICPYLDYRASASLSANTELKVKWLTDQEDSGATFYSTRDYVREGPSDVETNMTLNGISDELEILVVDLLGDQIVDRELTLNDIREILLIKKDSKSISKRLKVQLSNVFACFDKVAEDHQIDLSKYALICLGVALKNYRSSLLPETFKGNGENGENKENGDVTNHFWQLVDRYQSTQKRANETRLKIEKKRSDARKELLELLEKDFKIDQQGRILSPWSALSMSQKRERIESYCNWYAREHDWSIERAQEMSSFVWDQMTSKNLKPSDIEFKSRNGYITNINVIWNEDLATFERLKTAPRTVKKKNAQKKSIDHWLGVYGFSQVEVEEMKLRLNRLILRETLMSSFSRDKDSIMRSVIEHSGLPLDLSTSVMDYGIPIFEKIHKIVMAEEMDEEELEEEV